MYAGIPAEALSAVALLAFTAGGGGTFPVENARLLVPVAATVGFLPLALLIAFILRTATVTQRTAAPSRSRRPNRSSESASLRVESVARRIDCHRRIANNRVITPGRIIRAINR